MTELPSDDNQFHADHLRRLDRSLRRWTGRGLLPGNYPIDEQAARTLFEADFALVSHDTQADPVFNYGNATALRLFEMTWEEFTALPSRRSAEPMHRDERQRLMAGVARDGYFAGYSGIRAAKSGRRFVIENVTVWNVLDEDDRYAGQAATYATWRYLEDEPLAPGPRPLAPRMTERREGEFLISTDRARLDMDAVCGFLARSYWANRRPRGVIERAIANSLCIGIYASDAPAEPGRQIAFARVVTDYATFAWLCDVFVDEEFRGRGLGKRLVETALAHPDLQGLRRWMLATADAHDLYRQYGFVDLAAPERWMERFTP